MAAAGDHPKTLPELDGMELYKRPRTSLRLTVMDTMLLMLLSAGLGMWTMWMII